MRMLSDDDTNLAELSDEELDDAWDLWFDLAQSTNDADPLYAHGVFAGVTPRALRDAGNRDSVREGGRSAVARSVKPTRGR